MKYESIIGLEIHVQLKTKSKMFCASKNNPDEREPNTNICEVCTGQPGVLPVTNKEAVQKGILVGLALNCEIPEYSKFDRKNYFYPDLPKGYQISQYDQPLCSRGQVGLEAHGQERTIRITRAHLEEDAGKLIHEGNTTLVDLNRAGVPLLEVVTEPDFREAREAKIFLHNLRNIVRYLGVSDADMEKGHMRCDANISLRKEGETALPNYKVEIKNLNSFKAVEAGLNYEIQRQTETLEAGEKLVNETRGWDEVRGATVSQRTKEEAHDYRYFPEPDLPIMHFSKEDVEKIRAELPELPAQKLARFMNEYGLPAKDAEVLVNDKSLAGYFEEVVSELQEWISVSSPSPKDTTLFPSPGMGRVPEGQERSNAYPSSGLRPPSPARGEETRNDTKAGKGGGEGGIKTLAKQASNWVIGDFQALLKAASLEAQDSQITPENLAELIKMIDKGEVSSTAGKKVLGVMFERGGDPSHIAEDEGLRQVSDEGAILAAVEKVIAENPNVVADFKAGKKQALGFLVGRVMAAMQGQANPQVVNKLLEEKLRN